MYVSRYIEVHEDIFWKKRQLSKLKGNKKLDETYYILCTSPVENNLFEVIQGHKVSSRYEACYILGISKDKGWLIGIIHELVDKLYNTKELVYPMLEME